MGTQAVSCNNCGAPLEVSEDTNYAACGFCGSRLQIRRSGGAVYSDVLEVVSRQAAEIADDVETIRLQNELERLDREWMLERERYVVRGRDGGAHRPSRVVGVLVVIVMGGFGVFWTSMAISMGAPFFFPMFGFVFVGVAVGMGVSIFVKSDGYARGEKQYQTRRKMIVREMERRRHPG